MEGATNSVSIPLLAHTTVSATLGGPSSLMAAPAGVRHTSLQFRIGRADFANDTKLSLTSVRVSRNWPSCVFQQIWHCTNQPGRAPQIRWECHQVSQCQNIQQTVQWMGTTTIFGQHLHSALKQVTLTLPPGGLLILDMRPTWTELQFSQKRASSDVT